MQRHFLLSIFLLMFVSLSAKDVKGDKPLKKTIIPNKQPAFKEDIYMYFEREFIFPEGVEMISPEYANINFIVGRDGKIRDVKLIKDKFLNEAFKKEAIRVIENMPNWEPAYHKGKNVSVYYTKKFPIPFPKVKIYEKNESDHPEFIGGIVALSIFLKQNIKYPVVAQEQGVQGIVKVSFLVEENGKISDICIERSVSPEIDMEAIRVVKAMPNWIPAKKSGKATPKILHLPIKFSLD